MYPFTYHRPASLEDAASLLANADDGRPVAGGMSLIPTMKFRLSSSSDLVDLNGLSGLAGISREGDNLTIGAMTRHAEVAASEEVARAIPALAQLAGGIGDVQVRNRGTIGGSICFNDPAADYPAGVLGLGATIKTNRREIAADDFFVGLYETALDEGEIVTAVRFSTSARAGWAKFANLASRFAIVAVMASIDDGKARLAVTGAKACVYRIPEMEAALSRNFAPEALDGIAVSADGLNADLHADADYRAHMVGVMAKRAVVAALG